MMNAILKQQGMEEAAVKRAVLLDQAREHARRVAGTKGTVTADDIDKSVREALGPAAGSIFKGGDFQFTGQRVTSKLPSNHARELKVWQLTQRGKQRVTAPATPVNTRQAEGRLNRPPVTPEVTEVSHAPLPSWLK
jgi:hypothetical protein